jgi:hypothetical protein
MKWGIERSNLATRMAEIPRCGEFINHQYDRYLRLKFLTNWRLIRNPASHRAFARSECPLSTLQRRILAELNENGVAVCHFDELFGNSGLWARLSDQFVAFSESKEMQSCLEERRKAFEATSNPNDVAHYILTYYAQDQKPLIQTTTPLLELAASCEVLNVVNAYLGMLSKIIYFDMWRTLPMNTDTRILSQRWHRDPEDRKKIRIFLYFNHVDEEAGAMEYFAGSQLGGPYQNLYAWADPLKTPYPPEGAIEKAMPESRHVALKGPPGTLVFCDTAGLHRGGVAKTRPRILATAAFVTPASLHGRRYEISKELQAAQTTRQARFAVS